MTYCLNPDCQKPRNPDSAKTCRSCGAKLILKDRYRAIAAIGQGGFGRTFLAVDEDKPSKPRCVIKQFLPIAQNPRNLKKAATLFAQEAVRLEELGHHPQIPELLAYFNQEGQQYLIQEFIHGKNLADVLAEQGAFTEAQVREVLASLLPVLDFVHSHNVIHRDIKPGNIISTAGSRLGIVLPQPGYPDWAMLQQALSTETAQRFRNFATPSYRFSDLLTFSLSQPPRELAIALATRCQQLAVQFARYSSLPPAQRQYLVADANRLLFEAHQAQEATNPASLGQLVLVDFGAAKSLKGLEPLKTGTTIGSPEYVAPEQARGKAVFLSDLYSLGVTCIHLLTKVSPYDLFDPHENQWVWHRYLSSSVSDKLSSILDRLLEAAIPRRYQSAAGVLQDLEGTAIAIAPFSAPIPPLFMQSVQPSLQVVPPQPPAEPIPTHPRSNPSGQPPPLPFGRRNAPSGQPPSLQPSFRITPPRSLVPAAVATATVPMQAKEPEAKARRRSQPSWRCIHTFESPGRIYAIALSPTTPILVSSSGNTIKLWDLKKLQPIRTLTGHLDIIPSLALSPDGTLLISGSADKTIHLWELHTGKRLSSLRIHADTILALAVSPDGTLLASSSFYDPITLWDLKHWEKRNGLCGHTARIDALAFSPFPPDPLDQGEPGESSPLVTAGQGGILASGSADLTIKLWDVTSGDPLRTLEGHTHQITDLAFSPDGTILASSSWDGTIKLWNLKSRRQPRTLDVNSGRVNRLAFSSDGKKLAIASDTLQLWNLPSGKKLTIPDAHADTLCAVTFGHDDQTLISASSDRTIKIWQYQ